MKTILEQIEEIVSNGFADAGYDSSYGKVGVSNRPDLCEFQCNGALSVAKKYHKAPMEIAQEVCTRLTDNPAFSGVEAAAPGFLNIKVSDDFLAGFLNKMESGDKFGLDMPKPMKIIVDYGGPNVAKPLHVGHLRAAIIGESIKRICRYFGNEVIGDVHLGDWGLQMGLIITELRQRKPYLEYFNDDYTGSYSATPPFTLEELEEIYPCASAKSKEDEKYKEEALLATRQLQDGKRGYRALWRHIINVSVPDLKRNYRDLDVDFDWWKGESSVDDLIGDMVDDMKDGGFAYESEGALVVDVAEESDTKEIPPCMILKSDGAALYTTTDLATLLDRERNFSPDRVIYVVDKRQEMHFIQVFRCAKKCGIVPKDTALDFLGFGTMNGKDGKPFKTREGGVMRLETLIADIRETMLRKIMENHETDRDEAADTARTVALAAIKYGDLSNQATKDYIFDTDKFTSFEGNTGPYILYTIVRIKSILNKYTESEGAALPRTIGKPANELEKALMLDIAKFSHVLDVVYVETAPHRLCAYIYEICNDFNRFYHETRILTEENREQKQSWIALLLFVRRILETCIDLLGFSAPEKM